MKVSLTSELCSALDDQLQVASIAQAKPWTISLLTEATDVLDGTAVFLIRNAKGDRCAVALCSAFAFPSSVSRGVERARAAKLALGPVLGTPILDPLAEGTVLGRSFAVLPYCAPLSDNRAIWFVQRTILRPAIFDWLYRATQRTARSVDPALVNETFAIPLQHLVRRPSTPAALKAAAARASDRLASGAWTPKHVLMHGDLWKGNILIRPPGPGIRRQRWHERLALIDWPGSAVAGFAVFDLVRLAASMGTSARKLSLEIERHCRALDCVVQDAESHLISALAHYAANLENFPEDRFQKMAAHCLDRLRQCTSR